LSPCEISEQLAEKPYVVQRLGHVANNAGIFDEFQELVERYHCDLGQLKSAVKQELQSQGIKDVDGLLALCDIPSNFDD
jgi:hypothetical protein